MFDAKSRKQLSLAVRSTRLSPCLSKIEDVDTAPRVEKLLLTFGDFLLTEVSQTKTFSLPVKNLYLIPTTWPTKNEALLLAPKPSLNALLVQLESALL